MTTEPDLTEAMEVLDRETAADILDEVSSLLDHTGIGQVADLIRDGEYDEHEVIRLVAGYRKRVIATALEARDARVRELEGALGEIMAHFRTNILNAPGHGHRTPGIWDDDISNGEKAGRSCQWCADWQHARTILTKQEPKA